MTRLQHNLLVFVFLMVHAVLAASSVRDKSATFDEPPYVLGGIAAWKLSDYRLNPDNGILPQLWQSLPVVLTGSYNGPIEQSPGFMENNNLAVGQHVFYNKGTRLIFGSVVQPETTFFPARMMTLVLSLGLGLTVYGFSRRLYGPGAGLLSLALYTLCPTALAHGALATSDLITALFFTLSVGFAGLWFERATAARGVLAGASFTGLVLSKYSCILLGPILLAMALGALVLRRRWPIRLPGLRVKLAHPAGRATALTLSIVLAGLIGWAGIWAGLSFRYQAVNPAIGGTFKTESTWQTDRAQLSPGMERVGRFIQESRMFPEAYSFGLVSAINHAQKRSSFFLGQLSEKGRPAYFPVAWVLKTPPALLMVQLLAAVAGLALWLTLARQGRFKRLAIHVRRTWPWWTLIIVIGASCVTSQLNIGVRHLLPLLPASFILAGALAKQTWQFRKRVKYGLPVLAGLVGLMAVDTAMAWPNYISYYTPLVGGTSQGYKYLGDSNTDWGQDLPALKKYAELRGLRAKADDLPGPDGIPRRLYVSYFGVVPLETMGIDGEIIQCMPPSAQNMDPQVPLQPGYYALSNTLLQRLFQIEYKWTSQTEETYRLLTRTAHAIRTMPPGTPSRPELTPETQKAFWNDLRLLQATRMNAALFYEPPDDQLNGSINIYYINQERLDRLLYGPGPVEP